MNALIQFTSGAILELYKARRAQLESMSTAQLVDLQHECGDLKHHADFSVRTAAEINRTAAAMVLEERSQVAPLALRAEVPRSARNATKP